MTKQIDRDYEEKVRKSIEEAGDSPNNLEDRAKTCLGYYTKYKIVCERCKDPYNKDCPFYIAFKSKRK